ncbi:sigma-54-dependent transcriptional regulator [Myroides sp. LJL110]
MKKTNTNVLILDDNLEILLAAKMLLKRHFSNIYTLDNPKKLIWFINQNDIQVVLLDMNYRIGFEDGKEGIFWLKEIKKACPNTQLILMTSYGNLQTAVQGIKLGALDYILKPWNNQELVELVKSASKKSAKQNKQQAIRKQDHPTLFKGIDPNVTRIYQMGEKIAKTDINTLVLGENGTGKYVLAKYIHDYSHRKDKPFIHVDLGSLNENLFESELFGYCKGAFTDAKQDTPGRFELAHTGSIFLDEIANIPLHLQAKLLQVIQSKTVTRLGESTPKAVDIRIICATNENLEELVEKKLFREDLFYRINTMILTLPPLRNRPMDIGPLLNYFMDYYCDKYDKNRPTVESNTIELLKSYPWKGNIRELQNKTERAIILNDSDTLDLYEFGINHSDLNPIDSDNNNLQDIQRNAIVLALEQHKGNISQCALELGLSRAALYRRIQKYDIKF